VNSLVTGISVEFLYMFLMTGSRKDRRRHAVLKKIIKFQEPTSSLGSHGTSYASYMLTDADAAGVFPRNHEKY
jgi:hypothetical protein